MTEFENRAIALLEDINKKLAELMLIGEQGAEDVRFLCKTVSEEDDGNGACVDVRIRRNDS